MKIESILSELESSIPKLNEINEKVSKVNVGWQIDHSFNVILAICKTIQASDPAKYEASFNIKRSLLLTIGSFPRGKAKAPKATIPVGEITEEGLRKKLELVRAEIPKIASLDPNAYFYHPIFKKLNLKRTHRFIALHTNHHLKIIKDILK